jgi:hypothetical protein
VVLEEPHHGVQFGVNHVPRGLEVGIRDGHGAQIFAPPAAGQPPQPVAVRVPLRQGGRNVIAVAELYKRLAAQRTPHPQMPAQTGGGSFALQVLNPPWRQRFEGRVDHSEVGEGPAHRVLVNVAVRVQEATTQTSYLRLIALHE